MGVVVSLVVFIGCVGVRPTFIPQAIFKLHPFRLSSSFSCSLIDLACSRSMLAVLLRVCHVLCPGFQREARYGYFLTGTFRPRIHEVNVAGPHVESKLSVTVGHR